MPKVELVHAREIIDSRGNPTLEAEVTLSDGSFGRASVPSGASTGSREAVELRDGNKSRYLGKGVLNAVENITKKIAPAIKGKDGENFMAVDKLMIELDGTEYKSNLGANAVLGVSMALCRAAAASQKITLHKFLQNAYYDKFLSPGDPQPYRGITLPTPMMNILNGGKHADNNLSIQEFMIIPAVKGSFKESLRAGVEVFHHLKSVLHEKKLSTNVGDEGGFAPMVGSNFEALDLIVNAIARAGYRPGHDVFLALDCAASEFRKDSGYAMSGSGKETMDSAALVAYYADLCMKYPIVSIEDGLDESDWAGWKILTKELGKKVMLVGDDLFVTNAKILKKGIEEKTGNSILIKINQIGSITETLETIAMARKAHYNTVVSHRSGETEDTFLADLAVATDSGLVKTGSASRGERMAKYNQLLRIEEELGTAARFNGLQSLGMKF